MPTHRPASGIAQIDWRANLCFQGVFAFRTASPNAVTRTSDGHHIPGDQKSSIQITTGEFRMADDPSSFATDLWASLEAISVVRRYESGTLLFEQGESASGIYLIQKGQVRLWIPEGSGPIILATSVASGTMLALSEAISEGTHKLSAMALAQTEAGFVPRETLMGYLREHHKICLQVVRTLSEDLHGLYHSFQRLNLAHPRSRRWQPDGGTQ